MLNSGKPINRNQSVQVVALIPNVEPLLFTVEPGLVLTQVVEVYQAMRSVTLGTAVITIHLAATDRLPSRFLLPGELERLEVGALM